MFKVVPDQLRISDGWVRCGQCGEVFDASQHLLANPIDMAAPVDSDRQATPDNMTPSVPPLSEGNAEAAVAPEAPIPVPAPHPPSRHDPEPASNLAPQSPPRDSLWVETVAPRDEVAMEAEVPVVPQQDPPVAASPFVATQPSRDDAPPELSFIRNGNRQAVWQRPVVRIVLLLLVVLLLAALAVQVLVHQRDRIVSMEPSTRPVLLALCAWTQCKLSPLRQIESIVIESSSFALVRADIYKLAFTLKNNAVLDLAMPAIELSLTDTQDQPLIRRVIMPAEFGVATSKPFPAGSDWSGSLSLSVKSTASVGRIAGYRLLAFYP